MASLCSNPHIVECKDGWVDERTSACIVTSCCEGGDIAERSRRQGASYFLKRGFAGGSHNCSCSLAICTAIVCHAMTSSVPISCEQKIDKLQAKLSKQKKQLSADA
ncbi:uncharacterized protein LOC100836902 [Brachypodium distachyon]|uniref:uncharacterized protein LOC100836902 n=1 Tax=Brachypodium distachyon TaxID=15368 RepID=UPI00053001B2|nr:uncharacterized protein LOC100836902 [Brachypodium distachyon]XP_014757428.1 uncharacterized protein LOC100836902 [Brachypodium distachyon]|eukprot:XP_010238493.1 uncharacterized protein LOC100836902 [Brachypodium distachyon]